MPQAHASNSRQAVAGILGIVTATLGVAVTFSSAPAQLRGVPVFYSPIHDPDVSFHFDYGDGFNALGLVQFVGGRVGVGLGYNGQVRLTAGAGAVLNFATPNDLTVASNVAVGLWRRKIILMDVQAGIGYVGANPTAGTDVDEIDFPVGVALGLAGLTPASWLSNVQLWAAPRGQLRYTSGSVGGSDVSELELGGGVGVGLELLFPVSSVGLGVQAAVEWLWIAGGIESAFGLGGVLRVLRVQ